MRLAITSDSNAGSGVGEVVDELSGPTEMHFVPKDYGAGLVRIVVVLMCRDPELAFKRRLRLSAKERILYMDIMLDLDQMRRANHQTRRKLIVEQLIREIPAVLRKYKDLDFDEAHFLQDLTAWFTTTTSMPPS